MEKEKNCDVAQTKQYNKCTGVGHWIRDCGCRAQYAEVESVHSVMIRGGVQQCSFLERDCLRTAAFRFLFYDVHGFCVVIDRTCLSLSIACLYVNVSLVTT